jgi:thioredoxin 1
MDEVLSTENAIAYFTATWCQPCKALKPIMAKIGIQDEINNYFVIDVDSIDKEYLDLYNIKSVPTILKMDKGVVVKDIRSRTESSIIDEINN